MGGSTAHASDSNGIPDVSSRADAVSARATARVERHRVEITDLRTDRNTTYANPDGTLTLESSLGPIRVQQDGGWVSVDPTLVADAKGVHPRAIEGSLSLSTAGSPALATLTDGLHSIVVNWAGSSPLPTPTLSGRTATYTDALPGVDVRVLADAQGFEYSLVFHSKEAALSLATSRWPLTITGLNSALDPLGGVSLSTATGAVV
ncbi:MAG: LamG domain-containing protein, partial [Actinomycetota bacterium]|nr:LamG domain-containing protein [Actinomycetota bacterium]